MSSCLLAVIASTALLCLSARAGAMRPTPLSPPNCLPVKSDIEAANLLQNVHDREGSRVRMCVNTPEMSSLQLEGLVVPRSMHLELDCNWRVIEFKHSMSAFVLADGARLVLRNCLVAPETPDRWNPESIASDVAAAVSGSVASEAILEDSIVSAPCKESSISQINAVLISREQVRVDAGMRSTLPTHPNADVGPRVTFQNVRAACISAGVPAVPFKLRQLLQAAASPADEESGDDSTNTADSGLGSPLPEVGGDDSDGDGEERNWIVRLAVVGGLLVLWAAITLLILLAVRRDRTLRAKAEEEMRGFAASTAANGTSMAEEARSLISRTSGSDMTTAVVTPGVGAHSPVNMTASRVSNALFNTAEHSVGAGSTVGMGSMTGVPVSPQRAATHSSAGGGGEPYLPHLSAVEMATPRSDEEEALAAATSVAAGSVRGTESVGGGGGPMRLMAMEQLRREPSHGGQAGRSGSTNGYGAAREESVDRELVRKAAGVGTPTHKGSPSGMPTGGDESPAGRVLSMLEEQHVAEGRRFTPGGAPALSAANSAEVLKSQSDSMASVRRMKEAVHREMMEMQGDLQEQQLKIFSVLGRGGYGTVYHGEWRGLEVAIKTVIFQSDESDNTMSRLASEAAIASNLSHTNVVAMYSHDICTVNSDACNELDIYKFYLIQEYCNGGSLRHAIVKGTFSPGALPNRSQVILSLLQQTATAITYLHTKRICHGDLNPANVLLKYDLSKFRNVAEALSAGQATVKVGDFGLSRKIQLGRSHTSDIKQGTPFFVAPEVAGQRRLHKSSDVYSFGVIMWELFMGCPVYTQKAHTQQAGGSPVAPGQGEYVRHPEFPNLPPSAPEMYVRTVHACLCHHPEDRPQFSQVESVLSALGDSSKHTASQRQGGSGSGRASNKSRQSGRSGAGSAADYFGDSSTGISQPRKLSVTSKHTESQSHTPDRRAARHAEPAANGVEPFRVSPPAAVNGGAAVRPEGDPIRGSTNGRPTLRRPPSEATEPGGHEITAYVSRSVQPHPAAAEERESRQPQRRHDRPRSDPAQASHIETSHEGTSSSFLSQTSWGARDVRERERGGGRSASAPRPSGASGGMGAMVPAVPVDNAAALPPQQQPAQRPRLSERQRQRRRAMQQLLSEGDVSDFTETPTSAMSRTPLHLSPQHRGSAWSASIWDSMPNQVEVATSRGGRDGHGRSPVARPVVRPSSRSWHGAGTGSHAHAHAHARSSNARAAEAHAAAVHAASRSPPRGVAMPRGHVEVEDDPLPRGVGIGMPRNLRAALNAQQIELEDPTGQRRGGGRQWY